MATSYKLLGEGNYIDASGVAYNKTPLDEYLDNLKITTYAKRYDAVYTTTSANQTNIPISLSVFNESTPLFIGINGLIFSEGTDYTIDYTNKRITLTKPIEVIGTKVQIVVLKQVSGTEQTFELLKGEAGQDGAGFTTVTGTTFRIWDQEPGTYVFANTTSVYYNGATNTSAYSWPADSIIQISEVNGYKSWIRSYGDPAGRPSFMFGYTTATSGSAKTIALEDLGKVDNTEIVEGYGFYIWPYGATTEESIALWQKIYNTTRTQDAFVAMPYYSYSEARFITVPQGKISASGTSTVNSNKITSYQTVDSWGTSHISESWISVTITTTSGTVTNVTYTNSGTNGLGIVAANENYGTPFEPEYDGDPATKKYVDDYFTTEGLLEIGTNQTSYSNYFTYNTPGTYGFSYSSSTGYFENNNKSQDNTTAETNITLSSATTNGDLIIYYEVSSEQGYDKFTLTVGGEVVVSELSGSNKSGSYICPALSSGTVINLKYSKDNSTSSNGDYAKVKLQKTSQIANNAVAPGNFITKAQFDSAIGNINQALAKLTDL